MKKFFILTSSAIIMFGCQSLSKKEIEIREVKSFQEKKTTKAEIEALYGKPQKESLSGNFTGVCFYNYTTEYSGRKDQLLFLQFDDADLLVSKNFNDARAKEECKDVIPKDYSGGFRSHSGGKVSAKHCGIDIECGVNGKCNDGICTGGVERQHQLGKCQIGNTGKKYCTNNSRECTFDHDCN